MTTLGGGGGFFGRGHLETSSSPLADVCLLQLLIVMIPAAKDKESCLISEVKGQRQIRKPTV